MSYYNTQERPRPPMGGLSQLMEMQGRRGDSELVHMNPVEVRMLEAMSPDGRLSINPETGLQEAFKLRDSADAQEQMPVADIIRDGISGLFAYGMGLKNEQPFSLANDEYADRQVPTNPTINDQPHQLSYINDEEAGLLRSLGGSGQEFYGIPAYYSTDAAADESNTAANASMDSSVGVADDVGAVTGNATTAANEAAEAQAQAEAIGEADAYSNSPQAYGLGFGGHPGAPGVASPHATGLEGFFNRNFPTPKEVLDLIPFPVPIRGLRSFAEVVGKALDGLGIGGESSTADEANEDMEDESIADTGGGGDYYEAPYGDPYNTQTLVADPIPDPVYEPVPRIADRQWTGADLYNAATTTGIPNFFRAAEGGLTSLAYGGSAAPTGYANQAFEGMVPGAGTGMSDDVPFSIEGQQPALLSRDEYVLPADIVSQLGDGSSNAGSGMLDNFVSQVRQTKYGNTEQPPANGGGLMASLMRQGGMV